jgi:carboxyl-terminal processing protease
MSMKSRFFITFSFMIILIIFAFNAGYVLGQSPWAPVQIFYRGTMPVEAEETFAPFWEVWGLVQARYFEQPLDDEQLMQGAINGMLAALGDPNTRYLSPEAEARAREGMAGEFEGIGAEITFENGDLTIVSPIEGSPAEAAGLLPGDILRAADGVELSSLDIMEAARLVRGPAGTIVTLTVERKGETFLVEVVRGVIRVPSVRGELLEENIAYVRLTQFGYETDADLQALLETLLPQNPRGLILDLRRNPGGGLDTVVGVADQFLDEGVILVERFGDGRERVFSSTDQGLAQQIPLVVLIDAGSASASEVLAGAVRARGRGVLIGQTTFGKGTIQTWHPLSNGGGVRITVARWLTPDETWVNEGGLAPDYFIPLPEEQNADAVDAQLQAAIAYLLGERINSVPPAENDG